jgi:hypothetical protein
MPKQTTFNLGDDVDHMIRLYAQAQGISMSRAANRIFRKFFKSMDKQELDFMYSFKKPREFVEDDEPLDIPDDVADAA